MAGISYVFTITRVAEMLGEDEEWLDEISIVLDPEDGRLGVLGLGDESTTAFTRFGIENLAELVQIYKTDPSLLPRPKIARMTTPRSSPDANFSTRAGGILRDGH
jgi:hypothetical protein